MLAYWFLFLMFTFGAVMFTGRPAYLIGMKAHGTGQDVGVAPRMYRPGDRLLIFASILPALMIGLRYDVGTDWGAYQTIFDEISRRDLFNALKRIDIGYAALNWLAAKAGADIWLVNLVCGALFIFGLVRFAKAQPNPWLAFAVAAPYFIIGVGMGYTRQAVAIGLAMGGLATISRGSFGRFMLWVLAGALFHRTAVILIPIVGIAYTRNRLQAAVLGIVGCVAGYYILTSGQGLEHFQRAYVNRVYESQGAGIRLAMNLPPALIYLSFARRFTAEPTERLIWRNFAIIAAASFFGWMFIESTTPLDRMALYLIPLQVYVFARLPTALSVGGVPSRVMVVAVVAYSALVEFIWLNYSNNAQYWIPYKLYPISGFG